jgi:hypothetical protein
LKLILLDCGVSRSSTPERLANRLSENLEGRGVQVQHNGVVRTLPYDSAPEEFILVRWGATRNAELDQRARAILNPANAIAFNINKKESHRRMMQNGVRVPQMWESFNQARRANGQRRILSIPIPTRQWQINTLRQPPTQPFLRRRRRHTQGRDIIVINPGDRLPKERRTRYYTQLVEKEEEYRLHMFHNKCIGLAHKVEGTNPHPIIWNFYHGWNFDYIPQEEDGERDVPYYNEMVEEASKALTALSLDFGSVDVILQKDTHLPYVLEVNTSPKLHNTKRFSKAIVKWLKENHYINATPRTP